MSALNPIHTRFGTITETQMIVVNRSLFKKRSRAIPLTQIESVRQDVHRHMGIGTFFLVLAGAAYAALTPPVGIVSAALLSIMGILFLWGTPTVIVTTTGGYTRRLTGTVGAFAEADRFVAGIRSALINMSGRQVKRTPR